MSPAFQHPRPSRGDPLHGSMAPRDFFALRDRAQRRGQLMAPAEPFGSPIAIGRCPCCGDGLQAGRITDDVERGQKRRRKWAFRFLNRFAQVVERDAAAAKCECLVQGTPQRDPFPSRRLARFCPSVFSNANSVDERSKRVERRRRALRGQRLAQEVRSLWKPTVESIVPDRFRSCRLSVGAREDVSAWADRHCRVGLQRLGDARPHGWWHVLQRVEGGQSEPAVVAGVKSRSDKRVEGAGSHRRIWRREQRAKNTRRRDGEISTFSKRLACQRRGPMVADDLERAKDREPCAPGRGPGGTRQSDGQPRVRQ